jgi:20S proteasome alpha/beta subunit
VVVRAVDAAMKRDVASGDNYDIVVISDDGFRELSPEEKQSILNS